MEQKKKKYKNPPIIEAICQISEDPMKNLDRNSEKILLSLVKNSSKKAKIIKLRNADFQEKYIRFSLDIKKKSK